VTAVTPPILAEVLDAIADGVFVLDGAGRITCWNRRMETITGTPRDRTVGAAIADIVADWGALGESSYRRALATGAGEAVTGQLDLRHAGDDRPTHYEAEYRAIGAPPAGVVVTLRDVTTTNLVREELAESNTRFQIMADTSPVLLWMAGTDGLCNFFNQRWLAFTGRTMEMEMGNGWAEGVHPEDFQRCMDTYLNAFVARRAFRMHYRLRRADGQYRWLLDTGVPRYTPSGAFAGYIGSCIDVTEQKRARDELDRRVQERTAELEAFTRSVSHDLRAPLRGIDGFGRALEEEYADKVDATGRDYIDRMRKAAAHMGSLIDGLLQLSRVGTGELRFGPCDLSGIARDAATALREAHPEAATQVMIEDGLVAYGDARLLRIALDNLLGNAWKFTGKTAEPRIEVRAQAGAERTLVFVVRDNGVGFDLARATKLFAAFQRFHVPADFPGTGLGLATVNKIITRHRGRIWAESAVGKGAAFFVSLPLDPPASVETFDDVA
jgi:PAS domain S-box-containing protein